MMFGQVAMPPHALAPIYAVLILSLVNVPISLGGFYAALVENPLLLRIYGVVALVIAAGFIALIISVGTVVDLSAVGVTAHAYNRVCELLLRRKILIFIFLF